MTRSSRPIGQSQPGVDDRIVINGIKAFLLLGSPFRARCVDYGGEASRALLDESALVFSHRPPGDRVGPLVVLAS